MFFDFLSILEPRPSQNGAKIEPKIQVLAIQTLRAFRRPHLGGMDAKMHGGYEERVLLEISGGIGNTEKNRSRATRKY